MGKLLLVVILMALVTYIPRVIPMSFLTNKKLSNFAQIFLKFIPLAALGALVFPDIFYSTKSIESSLVGCIASIVCAFFRLNVVIVVFAGILSAFAYEILFLI